MIALWSLGKASCSFKMFWFCNYWIIFLSFFLQKLVVWIVIDAINLRKALVDVIF